MKVFRGISRGIPKLPSALTIGNFDGVHLGHQALLHQLRAAANRLGLTATVMTFEPHPREFFAKLSGDLSKAPTRIANLRDNMLAMANAGVDQVIVEHFNATFASQSPQEFIEKILVEGLHVKWLMVGEDFCFGAKRAGNVSVLKEAGLKYGFEVVTLPTVMNGGVRVSSSAVREALALGDFARTQQLIGHPYTISGRVVYGKQLGRTLGFPTINMRISHQRPAISGIFVVKVHGLSDQALPAVASLGVRPTVDNTGHALLETHIFDFQQNCYGKLVQIEFLKKLRDEMKFPDLASMTEAIRNDERQARGYFAAASQDLRTSSATDRI